MILKKDYIKVCKSHLHKDSQIMADRNCKECEGLGHIGLDTKRNRAIPCHKCLIEVRMPISFIKIYKGDLAND